MNIQDHHFGPIWAGSGERSDVVVDVGALVRRLILFERVTLESNLLREVPELVRTLGYKGLMTLLDSGAVRVVIDAVTAGEIGRTEGMVETIARGGPLPLHAYHLASVSAPRTGEKRDQYLRAALQHVHEAPIPLKHAINLKRTLVDRSELYPPNAAFAAVEDTRKAILAHDPWIWSVIRGVVKSECGLNLDDPPCLEAEDLGNNGDFRAVVPFGCSGTVKPEEEDRIVMRSLLAAASINQRVRLMEAFDGVTGFQEQDVGYFEGKLSFFYRQLDPTVRETQFDRVVELVGLPSLSDLPSGTTVDVAKLLKIRDSTECKDFRTWVRTIDGITNAEIVDEFGGIREKLAEATHSRTGKAIKFVAKTGVGMVPVVGPMLSLGAEGADAVLGRLIGEPGPIAFLASHYRSIFVN